MNEKRYELANKTTGMILALLLALLAFGILGAQAAVQSDSLEVAADSLYTEDGALRVLPAFTDSLLAYQNRAPRNVATGYYIIIQKSTHKLHLYKNGVLLKTYPVAVGKNANDKGRVNDMATPEGHFKIASISASSTWRYTSPITGNQSGPGVYGPWFFSVDTSRGNFSGKSWWGIGIHGTSSPSSIGKNISHGCIRLYSSDVTELKNEVAWLSDPTQIRVDIIK